MKKLMIGIVSLVTAFSLAACANESEDVIPEEPDNAEVVPEENEPDIEHGDENDHAHMDHSSSGEVPEGLKEAENPTYPVGSKATIENGHMSGMEGAEAMIVGAYDTRVYAVSYDPTTGGERETNHKWVIHEELVDVGEEEVKVGSEVVLDADHMPGMEGALAVVESVEQTTVYMVDFTLTTSGEEIKNHKWVTEEELSPHEEHH
jgi:predicted small lipoprotein YifL